MCVADCEATFKARFKLREHLRSHTQEKVVACPTCGGMFANNTKFFDHIRRQTTIEGERESETECVLWRGAEYPNILMPMCCYVS